jgi:hypothetical protein
MGLVIDALQLLRRHLFGDLSLHEHSGVVHGTARIDPCVRVVLQGALIDVTQIDLDGRGIRGPRSQQQPSPCTEGSRHLDRRSPTRYLFNVN